VPKEKERNEEPSSSSAGHSGAIISDQSSFVCPVLDPGERSCLGLSEKPIINAQALPSRVLLQQLRSPASPGFASCSRLPKA
jgi:hypothetical protein